MIISEDMVTLEEIERLKIIFQEYENEDKNENVTFKALISKNTYNTLKKNLSGKHKSYHKYMMNDLLGGSYEIIDGTAKFKFSSLYMEEN